MFLINGLSRSVIKVSGLLFLGFVSCGSAVAGEYKWRLNFHYKTPDYFSSAAAACKNIDTTSFWTRGWTAYEFDHVEPQGNAGNGLCWFMVTAGTNSLQYLHSPNSTYIRYGNGCPANLIYDPTLGKCSEPDLGAPEDLCSTPPSESGPGVLTGNPVNFSNGNKFQVERDYAAGMLTFDRAYNGIDGLWRHTYSTHLRITAPAVALVHADGRESFFTLSGTTITPSPTERGSLARQEGGWVYRSVNNEVFHFDSEGRLTRRDSPVERIELSYLNDKVQVTDEFGNQLEITVRPDGQPLTLSGPLLQVTYTYDEENRLVALSRTQGGQSESRQYHYEDATHPRLLTGITDERGVRYASWSYDAQGRAISSEHAGGADRVSIDYNADGSSTVTNALGKQTTYRFQSIHGLKRITAIEGEPSANCPSSNSTFTYDARGLLTSKIDNKGNRTTYSYNARGLEISRTEAAGTAQARTITTEWHPDFFLPTSVTEPGSVTTYTYDAQGRRLSSLVTAY